MRPVWIGTTACLALALSPLSSALGQAPPAPSPEAATVVTLQRELVRLNESMDQLVKMLRETMERQRLDIVLRRIEVLHLDLAPIQEELRSARADKRSLEEEQMRLQALLKDLEEQMSHADNEVLRNPEAGQRQHDLRVQNKFLTGRVASTEQRIVELENELTDKRRQIDLFEEMVDSKVRSWSR